MVPDLYLSASQEKPIGLASDDLPRHCLVGGTRPSYHRTAFDRSDDDARHGYYSSASDGCCADGDSCAAASSDCHHGCDDDAHLSRSFAIDAGDANGDCYFHHLRKMIIWIRNLRHYLDDDGSSGDDDSWSRLGFPRSFRDRDGS